MKEITNDSKLTPAAREALDEFIQNYKDQVLRSATRVAGSLTGEIREISVRDVIEAINTIQVKGFDRRSRLRTMFSSTFTLSGIIYILIGIGFSIYEHSLSIAKEPSFMIIIVGLVIIMLGYIFGNYLKIRSSTWLESSLKGSDEQIKELSFVFLEIWQRIELEARNLVSQELGESRATIPLSRLIDELIIIGVLSKNDSEVIKILLRKRNAIAHNEFNLQKTELISLVKQAEDLLNRIHSATIR